MMETRTHHLSSVFLVPLTLFALISNASAQPAPSPNDQPPEISLKPNSNVFFAYGDTRFTDPAACELSDTNYRRAIVDGMAHADPKPDFLIMTGDIVYRGDDDHDWHV